LVDTTVVPAGAGNAAAANLPSPVRRFPKQYRPFLLYLRE
jgi:hypothetical protein